MKNYGYPFFFGGLSVLRRSICAAERDEAVAQLAH